MTLQRCNRCGSEKPLTDFYADARRESGRRASCKECERPRLRAYRQSERGKAVEQRYRASERSVVTRRAYFQSEERKKAQLEYNKSRKQALRDWHIKRKYNITSEEYEALLSAQNGCCALCGTDKPGGKGTAFAIDHCHSTGRVRGLLCSVCNSSLGKFGDNLEGILKVARYLLPQEVGSVVVTLHPLVKESVT